MTEAMRAKNAEGKWVKVNIGDDGWGVFGGEMYHRCPDSDNPGRSPINADACAVWETYLRGAEDPPWSEAPSTE